MKQLTEAGKLIRIHCIQNNLSLKDLSLATGISTSQLSCMTYGTKKISIKSTHKICEALNLTPFETAKFKEAVFISNPESIIYNRSIPDYISRFICKLLKMQYYISEEKINQCYKIIKS